MKLNIVNTYAHAHISVLTCTCVNKFDWNPINVQEHLMMMIMMLLLGSMILGMT
jgi:hypothetical protein